ncbi:hypothetical protein H4R35_000727 [Dimargaris xerosporica]|nr:hypothetical protein H4R35_000727 [Dimargaris xerosporica]
MNFPQVLDEHSAPQSLLNFYKDRLERALTDQDALKHQIDQCKILQSDYNQVQLELQQRLVELAEAQSALQSAQEALIAEKQKSFELAKENDGLKIRELHDRRLIRHLVKLAEMSSFNEPDGKAPGVNGRHKRVRVELKGDPTTTLTDEAAVKTPGPSEGNVEYAQMAALNESLTLKVTALEAQLDEQKRYYVQLNQHLTHQATLLARQEVARSKRDARVLEQISGKLKQFHTYYADNLKEIIDQRGRNESMEASYRRQLDQLEKRVKELQHAISSKENSLQTIRTHVEQEWSSRSQITLVDLQKRLEQLDQELLKVKKEKMDKERESAQRIRSLSGQVERSKGSFRSYRTRMCLEIEGVVTDCASLIRKLTVLEQTVLKLDISNANATIILQTIEDLGSRASRLTQELNRVKGRCLDQR